jgi:cyclopropane fatty-acyl-phospholipid synthase-like methyltransferase
MYKENFLEKIEQYYSNKVLKYGETPLGVDWNNTEGQILRFQKLCEVISTHDTFSINDLGCGYGAFYQYLTEHYANFNYHGSDISEEMIKIAQEKRGINSNASFSLEPIPKYKSDYTISSGIFNVKLNTTHKKWLAYLHNTLKIMDQQSHYGFAFNCLTCYADPKKQRNDLYYANPSNLFNFCKKNFSQYISLLHDYELYEFTIVVRKKL